MRAVSTNGFMLYPQVGGSQAAQPSPQGGATSSPGGVSSTAGMLQEYGSLAKNALAPSSTSIAEGYNTVYDWATGFNTGAAGAAPGTSSSGTFGGGNLANAAYGYAGGKLAKELFDNKGQSDIGGSIGASLGASAAVGGSAAGVAMGAQFGMMAGPIGALAGAVLGAAIGSLFGGGEDDYRFRTYSGDLGENSQLNTDQLTEKQEDWASINTGGKIGGHDAAEGGMAYGQKLLESYAEREGVANPNPIDLSQEAAGNRSSSYDRWVGSGDYSKNTSSAYKWLKEGNTFAIGDKYAGPGGNYSDAIDKDWASTETAFGKYTVGHIDDIPGRTNFTEGWVESVSKLDAAVASILTKEQIEASKQGLHGSIQGTPDWHNTSGQNYATDGMLFDRYVAIFELSGRDDLAEALVTAMDRSISGTAANEGERARLVPELQKILQAESAVKARTAASQLTRKPRTTGRGTASPTRRITITRPEGVISPAKELNYV